MIFILLTNKEHGWVPLAFLPAIPLVYMGNFW